MSQYKPYAVNDIIQNLNNKVSRTTAAKALENLVNEKRIVSKAFGKILIYSCNEQEPELPKDIDFSKFDFETVSQLRNDLIELERDKATARDALDSVTKEPENGELLSIIEKEETELREIESKLESLQNDWNPANDEIVKQIISRDTLLQKEISKRSKICKNLVATIKDSVCPKNMDEFLVCIWNEFYCLLAKYTNKSLTQEEIGFETIWRKEQFPRLPPHMLASLLFQPS